MSRLSILLAALVAVGASAFVSFWEGKAGRGRHWRPRFRARLRTAFPPSSPLPLARTARLLSMPRAVEAATRPARA